MDSKTTTPQENRWFTSWGYYVGTYAAKADEILKDSRMTASVPSATAQEMASVEKARENVRNAFPKESKYAEDKHVETAKLLLVNVDEALTEARQAVWDRRSQGVLSEPAMTAVVADANKAEEPLSKGLETARQGVKDALPKTPKDGGVEAATKLFKEVEVALGKLKDAVRIRLEGEATAVRENKALMEDAVPDATAEEKEKLDKTRNAAKQALAPNASLTAAGVKAEEAKVTQALNDVKEAIRIRAEMKKILGDPAMSGEVAVQTESEKKLMEALKAAREEVRKALPEKPTDADFKAALKLLNTTVKPKLVETTKAVEGRKARQGQAEKIRTDDLMKEKVADGAIQSEIQAVDNARQAVKVALPEGGAPSPAEIESARKLLQGVKQALAAATKEVQNRTKQVEEIHRRKLMSQAIDKAATEEEIQAVQDARDAVLKALPKGTPATPDAIKKADELLLNVEKALADATKGIKERRERQARANQIWKDDRLKQAIDKEATKEEIQAVEEARKRVLEALPETSVPTTEAVQKAEGLLDEIGTALTAATNGARERKVRLDRAKEIRTHKQMTQETAKGANADEVRTVEDARKAVLKALPEGEEAPTREAIKEGEALFLKVGEALAAAAEGVKTRRDETINNIKGHAPREVEALLRSADPDELVKAHDALGDAAFVGALVKGSAGRHGRFKVVMEHFKDDPNQANLKTLLVNGGFASRPEVLADLFDSAFAAQTDAKKETIRKTATNPRAAITLDLDQQKAADAAALDQITGLANAFADSNDKGAPKRLENMLAQGGLDHDPKILGALLQVGCKGDPAQLVKLTKQFDQPTDLANLKGLIVDGGLGHKPQILGEVVKQVTLADPPGAVRALATGFQGAEDRTNLKDLIEKGGLGHKPAVLGALFGVGCEGKLDKLKAFTSSYGADTPTKAQDLQDLEGMLVQGGLADDPVALGHLFATGCDGEPAKLKQVGQTFRPDKTKLKGLLTGGGMGGETLGKVLKSAFPGDPAKLVKLHDTFATDLSDLKAISDAFQGGDGPGVKFKRVLGHVRGNRTMDVAIGALKTTFLSELQGKPPELMQQAGAFQIKTGLITAKPTGVPPATMAGASLASKNAGEAADVAALTATNEAKGNPNIARVAQETTKAATAAKTASALATTFGAKETELNNLRTNPPRYPADHPEAGNIDEAERANQSNQAAADRDNAYAQLVQQAKDAQTAAAAAKVALNAAKEDLKNSEAELALKPDDAALTQRVQEQTTGVQKAGEAHTAADSAARAARAAQKAVALRDVSKTDMNHICGRHTFLRQFTTEGLDIVNSMYPEGATEAQVAAYIDEALDALIDENAASESRKIPTQASILDEPDGKKPIDVFLPKSGFTVRVVFKRIQATGKIEIRTCFPTDLDKIPQADMQTIKRALGK